MKMATPKLSDLIKTWLDNKSVIYVYSEDDKFDIDGGSLQLTIGSEGTALSATEVLIMSNLCSPKRQESIKEDLAKAAFPTIAQSIAEEPNPDTVLHAWVADPNTLAVDIGDFSLHFCKIDCRDPNFFSHIEQFINLHLNKNR